jgi:GntR family transcriptional repressor for pyruvate dehydrogenase complex
MDPPREAVRFAQVVREATLSEKVAVSIRESILDGALQPGQHLLSERELGEQFGVSRTVIREAVRELVASGLVESHTGRTLRVTEAGSEAVSRAMGVFLHRSDAIDYRRVHEVRTALEIDMAGYAAERATPEHLARLRTLNMELAAVDDEDVERAAELDFAFHRAIGEATGNVLFAVLLDAIGPVLLEIRRRAFASKELRRYALTAHQDILDRISAGDAPEARVTMRRHLETADDAWVDGEPATAPVYKR